MWTLFNPLLSVAAGITNHFQRPLNISQNGGTTLTSSQYAEFVPYVQFARAAYCPSNKIDGWQCGDACKAVPDFTPTLTGGDGHATQYFYVGFWPAQSAVVVAHQGTDPSELVPVLTDIRILPTKPDPVLFPNIPSDVKVHAGFVKQHKKTAPKILAEVKRLMAENSSTHVILIGHSLGGALAELDTLFMKLNLPASTTVRGVTFGTPRVGNPAWATYFDSQITDFTRMNNNRDMVPIIPGQGLGFRHPSGEIYIQEDGSIIACRGPDDSVDPQCSNLAVQHLHDGSIPDHNGPYHGILIGTKECTP
ncbi:alpha/beta-hydrolase [Lactarius akahatsu]|uniref:Alpha/beta-hydrolase n=1 Tax=Lactarius akahatsu TaxID=416441 RepID=A0AAD4L255_9AGAM|nr:alpha/beta-hydrolase [Lactarius akahatsu]